MSEFSISSQQLNRCDLIAVTGRVDSASTPELREALDAVTDAGRFNIVLNLSGVPFMSSAGLRQLLDTSKTCKQLSRGRLVLSEVPQKLIEVLDLAGLIDLFTLYETDVEAVGSF
jgi:anti-anti-sigma factor